MHIRVGESLDFDKEPWSKVEGPRIFGGWSEFCCDFLFTVSAYGSPSRNGDIASIVKIHPRTFAQGAAELFTEADNYSIEFNPKAQLTATQKISVLAAQLLADYMYFDGNSSFSSL